MNPDNAVQPVEEKLEPLPFDPFQHFVPDEKHLPSIRAIRWTFRQAQLGILVNCPPSRERSVAITELETACMWAIKAIVIQDHKPTSPTPA